MAARLVPTGAPLGAEVEGADLRVALSADEVRWIREALQEHLLLVFRGQRLSEEDQIRFTRHFGDPVPHVREQPDRPLLEIFTISNVVDDGKPIGALGYGELTFHSDLSYLPRPASYSVVYAVEVPRNGGDTFWANCYLAYEALSPELKARIAGLRAVHRHGEEKQNPSEPAIHPVVRTHPETRRKLLYVSPQFTCRIHGWSEPESRALLDLLLAHASEPRFQMRHRWRPGDLVIWDNRCTMHRREPFDPHERRILKRTQIFGELPF